MCFSNSQVLALRKKRKVDKSVANSVMFKTNKKKACNSSKRTHYTNLKQSNSYILGIRLFY